MKTSIKVIAALAVALILATPSYARDKKKQAEPAGPEIMSQWNGKVVAILGDSISDERQLSEGTDTYWHQLIGILGIEAHNYGISGHQTKDIVGQAERAKEELGDKIDAFIIFIGTNDFERSVELGEWFEYSTQNTTIGGPITVARRYRTPSKAATYRGRINIMMDYLKTNFPEQQVILLTPIHRGFSEFSAGNIQPDEYFTNAIGLYIDDYVAVMKETANIWAVPVIDLNAVCGLYPMNEQFHRYFMNSEHDVLHPNTLGHKRMAYAIAYQLLGYPASFKY